MYCLHNWQIFRGDIDIHFQIFDRFLSSLPWCYKLNKWKVTNIAMVFWTTVYGMPLPPKCIMGALWTVFGNVSGCVQDQEHTRCLGACRAPTDLWGATQGEHIPAECLSRNVITYRLKYVHEGDFTWVEMRRKLPSHSTQVRVYIMDSVDGEVSPTIVGGILVCHETHLHSSVLMARVCCQAFLNFNILFTV